MVSLKTNKITAVIALKLLEQSEFYSKITKIPINEKTTVPKILMVSESALIFPKLFYNYLYFECNNFLKLYETISQKKAMTITCPKQLIFLHK